MLACNAARNDTYTQTNQPKSYHIAATPNKLHFIKREAGHRDGFHSVWRIESSAVITHTHTVELCLSISENNLLWP